MKSKTDSLPDFWRKWSPLLLFGLPMITKDAITYITQQILYRSFSTQEAAVEAISSFGIAYNLVYFLQSFTLGLCSTSILAIQSRIDLKRASMMIFGICSILVGVCAFIGVTEPGRKFIQFAFTIEHKSVQLTRNFIFVLSGTLVCEAILQTLWGQFLLYKHSLFTAGCIVTLGVVQSISIVLLMNTSFQKNDITMIPVTSIYLGYACALFMTITYYVFRIWKSFPAKSEEVLTLKYFFKLYTPLTVVLIGWNLGFPLAKSLMTKTTAGSVSYIAQELAISSVFLPASRLIWDPLTYPIEPTVLTFGKKSKGYTYTQIDFLKLTAFYTSITMILAGIIVWIPEVQRWYLGFFMQLPKRLVGRVSLPLKVKTIFVPITGLHYLFLGNLLLDGATVLIIIATVMRVSVLVSTIYILAYGFKIGGSVQLAISITMSNGIEIIVLGILDILNRKVLKRNEQNVVSETKKPAHCPDFPDVNVREVMVQELSLNEHSIGDNLKH